MTEDEDNIVAFPGGGASTALNPLRRELVCSAEDVFRGAVEGGVVSTVVIGLVPDGSIYLATNDRVLADSLMLVKRAERMIIDAAFQDAAD